PGLIRQPVRCLRWYDAAFILGPVFKAAAPTSPDVSVPTTTMRVALPPNPSKQSNSARMRWLEQIVRWLENIVWNFGLNVGGETIPLVVILLLGVGVFLTLRLGFIQLRRLGHGFAVTSGKYDDPDEPGDVPHFQALTTALSATVGIGNIAGVAIAIHW